MSDIPLIIQGNVTPRSTAEALLAACVEYRAKLDKLETENAALRTERNRYRVTLEDIAEAAGIWASDKARAALQKEAQP